MHVAGVQMDPMIALDKADQESFSLQLLLTSLTIFRRSQVRVTGHPAFHLQ